MDEKKNRNIEGTGLGLVITKRLLNSMGGFIKVRTRCHNLKKLGLNHDEAMKLAGSRKGYWRLSKSPNLNIAISNKRLEQAGYLFFSSYYKTVKV